MDRIYTAAFVLLVLSPVVLGSWSSEEAEGNRKVIRQQSPTHFYPKRMKLASGSLRKRSATQMTSHPKAKESRKIKPAGILAPLEEEDIDNDETVSVAIGPPPVRPKVEKNPRRPGYQNHGVIRPPPPTNSTLYAASLVVRDILVTVAKDFVTSKLSPDFIFGQFIANSMNNFTREQKMKFEHEVLETIMKYQKNITHKASKDDGNSKSLVSIIQENKDLKKNNESDESWPDFSHLEKYVKLT